MKNTIQKKKQEGFTIIEVLIVLAIAGLIILIVFLAVPALQRNSRNTQRRSDVTSVLGALSEHINNNNGRLPGDIDDFIGNAKLGFYTEAGDVVYSENDTAITSNPTDENVVTVNTFSKCNNSNGLGDGATSRNVTAVYYVETSGDPQIQCQDM